MQTTLNSTEMNAASILPAVALPLTAAPGLDSTTPLTVSPPVAPSQQPITLNPEQVVALSALTNFIAEPDTDSYFFVLEGYAGTGKTFLMQEVRAKFSKRMQFVYTAPTNKAAKVLRSVTGSAITIFVLLGLRIEKSGELKKLVGGEKPVDLSDVDVIFLDEASMANKFLLSELSRVSKESHVKVVFLGDRGQLPPVGEMESPVWQEPNGARLSQVMRHDNQILKLVTEIRTVMHHFNPSIDIRSDNANGEGVWKLSKAAFKADIFDAATKGVFSDGSKGKVVAWRNVRVEEYNNLIRSAIFGAAAKPGHFLLGDRVVATGPCKQGDVLLLGTDDEAIVEGVVETVHPLEPRYKAIELKVRTEENKLARLLIIHPYSQVLFNDDCQSLAHEAKRNPKLWKRFWDLKELFHEVKYAYALTAHRAQGSTYHTVYVDYQDILLNRNRKEAFQCLYVASSRPTKRLILA